MSAKERGDNCVMKFRTTTAEGLPYQEAAGH